MAEHAAPKGAAYIVQKAQQRGVTAVELWLGDLAGRLLAVTVPVAGLESALEDGLTVSGALIGLRGDDEIVLVPDANTFTVLGKSESAGRGVGRLMADVQAPSGAPSPWCARSVLKRQLGRANALGYTFYMGATIEHRWLAAPGEARPASAGVAAMLARAAADALEAAGVAVRAFHAGRDDGAHWSYDLDWVDALTLADSLATHRRVVREVARAHGADVTFMPHPWPDAVRSRLDLFVSLVEGGKPSYGDAFDPNGLSPAAHALGAWLASEVPALELVFKGMVNSYTLQHDLPRVVTAASGRGEGGAAVHVRGPDSAANPYLTLALVLGVGLAAVREAPPTVKRTSAVTLLDASRAAAASAAVQEILGAELLEALVTRAHNESRAWRQQVTPWEVARYLDC